MENRWIFAGVVMLILLGVVLALPSQENNYINTDHIKTADNFGLTMSFDNNYTYFYKNKELLARERWIVKDNNNAELTPIITYIYDSNNLVEKSRHYSHSLILESMYFKDNISNIEHFPENYTVYFEADNNNNYTLIWELTNLTFNYIPDNTYNYCRYTFGNLKVDLKDNCINLDYTEFTKDTATFYFEPTNGTQLFNLGFYDPKEIKKKKDLPIYELNIYDGKEKKDYPVTGNTTIDNKEIKGEDFFTLISKKTSLSYGEQIYDFKNHFKKKIKVSDITGRILKKSNSLNTNTAKITVLLNESYDYPIYKNKLIYQLCNTTDNITKEVMFYNCSYNISILDHNETRYKWNEYEIKNQKIEPNETVRIKAVAEWDVQLGDNSRDYRPQVIVPKEYVDNKDIILEAESMTWWDSSWDYKKEVTIITDYNYTHYPANFSINLSNEYTTGKVNKTCKDIRFANSTETGELYYDVVICNLSNSDIATFSVHLDSITTNNETIYMYYGNPTIETTEDYYNTYHRHNNNIVLDAPFKLNSGSTTWDVSGQGNNGTITNAQRVSGGGMSFDGDGDYVDCGNDTSLQFGAGSFSIEAWIKAQNDVSADRYIVDKGTSYWDRYSVRVLQNSGVIRVWTKSSDGSQTYRDSILQVNDNTWYFVSVIFDRTSNNINIYINGSLNQGAQTGSLSGNMNPTSLFPIGSAYPLHSSFLGTIKQVYVYNITLSSSQISLLYNETQYPPTFSFGAEETSGETTPPTTTLNLPTDDSWDTDGNIIFNCSATDNIQLKNITLYNNISGTWTTNGTNNIIGTSNSTTFTESISDGSIIWNCYTCDNSSNCAFATNNFTVNIDTTLPLINFVPPTDTNGTTIPRDYTYVNVTTTDAHAGTSLIDFNNSLIGWWRFDNSTDFLDHSTYSNDGTNQGSTYTSSGKFGGARSYSAGDKIDINNDTLNKDFDALTIEAWFKPSTFSPTRWRTPLHRGTATSVGGSIFFIGTRTGDNMILATIGASCGVGHEAGLTNIPAQTGTWYHVVNSWDGTIARVYVNGNFEKQYSMSTATFHNNATATTKIGTSNAYHFDGIIDEVKIHERALSPEEINATYNAGLYRLYNNFTDLAEGEYTYTAYSQDLAGNVNQTETRTLTVDTTAPKLHLYTPQNGATYNEGSHALNYSSSDTNLDTTWYQYNGINTTLTGNTTFNIIAGQTTLTLYANDTANNINHTSISFTIDNTPPVVENISWETTGGFTDDTLTYNQIIDYIRADTEDTNGISQVNLTVTDPDNTIKVSSRQMTLQSGSTYNYTTDFTLDNEGTWTISITSNDTFNNINNTSTTFTVSKTTPTITEGIYAYDFKDNISTSDIDPLSSYTYDTIGIKLNFSDFDTTWTHMKDIINYTEDNINAKTFLTFYFGGNYDKTKPYTNTTCDTINNNFTDLTVTPYDDDILFILIEVNEAEENVLDFTNTIAQCIVNATANKFPVYVKDYTHANLDSSWVSTWSMITVSEQSNQSLITTEMNLLRTNTSRTRIYYNLTEELKVKAEHYHNNIMTKLRGTPFITTINYPYVAEVNTNVHDIIVFNNETTTSNYIINVSTADRNGKDVWDSNNKKLIEKNTDGNFTVSLNALSYTALYFEDLDHLTTEYVWKASSDQITYRNYTTGSAGSYTIIGTHDVEFEAHDPTYGHNNQFFIHYEWLNTSAITNYNDYSVVIIADKNTDAITHSIVDFSKTYGYISVGDYANTDLWENGKKAECDVWIDTHNVSIFLDGLDTGASGDNFATRFRSLIDYIRIDKNKKAITNDYTSYSEVGVGGIGDYDMKESFCARWDGTVGTPSYSWETWSVDYDRAVWARTKQNPQLMVSFGDIDNISKMSYCYAMYLVMYGTNNDNLFSYNQPNFQLQREIYTFNPGTQLENTWTEVNDTHFTRKYSNGIVHIHTDSHTWSIEDGRTVDQLELCFKFQHYASNPPMASDVSFTINNDTSNIYSITSAEIGSVTWETNVICRNITYNQDGKYTARLYPANRASAVGVNIWNANTNNTGVFSGYENSMDNHPVDIPTYNSYGRTGANDNLNTINWWNTFKSDDTTKASVDTISTITQTKTIGSGRVNITLSSTQAYDIEVWGEAVDIGTIFTNLYYWNTTDWILMRPQNTSTCDSENPTWNSTTIAGDIHKSCYWKTGDNYTVRIATPHLSTQVYSAETDATEPYVEILSPINTTYDTTNITLNYTSTDPNIDKTWYNYNSINTTLTDNITFTALDNQQSTLTLWANDTAGNINHTSITFTVDTINPTTPILITPINNTNSTDTTPNLNWTTVTETNFKNYTVQVDNNSAFTSIDYTYNTTTITESNYSVTSGWTNAKWYWRVIAYDSAGNSNTSNYHIYTVDTTKPYVEILSPTATIYTTTNITLNYTSTDTNMHTTWYNYNSTNTTLSGNITFTATEGQSTITLYANDTTGNTNSTNITFTTDTSSPTLTLYSPADITYGSTTINLNYFSSDLHLDKTWYEYKGINTTLTDNTTITAPDKQDHTITLWANDTLGNTASLSRNFTVITSTGGGGGSPPPPLQGTLPSKIIVTPEKNNTPLPMTTYGSTCFNYEVENLAEYPTNITIIIEGGEIITINNQNYNPLNMIELYPSYIYLEGREKQDIRVCVTYPSFLTNVLSANIIIDDKTISLTMNPQKERKEEVMDFLNKELFAYKGFSLNLGMAIFISLVVFILVLLKGRPISHVYHDAVKQKK